MGYPTFRPHLMFAIGQWCPWFTLTTMKKVKVSWKSHTSKGFFIRVKIEEDGFFKKYVVECTEELFDSIEKDTIIDVPVDALS